MFPISPACMVFIPACCSDGRSNIRKAVTAGEEVVLASELTAALKGQPRHKRVACADVTAINRSADWQDRPCKWHNDETDVDDVE